MRIVIAPDSFKGSASAVHVCDAIAAGWRDVRPDDELVLLPMADGGEGTLDAFLLAVPGSSRVHVEVVGPDGQEVEASWALLPPTPELPGGTGVVELAETSGLPLMTHPDPLGAHTLGFGQAIADALDRGVSRLLLAIGGSASTDGGTGALVALGASLLDADGDPLELGGGVLSDVARVDLSELPPLPSSGALVLSDVTNPLLGETGAAHVFGEQKGADAAQRAALDLALAHWARAAQDAGAAVDPSTSGAGAAGGTGFGLLAWGATLVSGASTIADAIGLDDALSGADLVITGEGRYDAQTDGGKAPAVVAERAGAAGVPMALVAGSIAVKPVGFADAVALAELAGDVQSAIDDPVRWLRRAGAVLAERAGRP
ncbi:glycerate kinase [Planctomonas sp. JC2975]|uniref:glycerate kinase n=1 Tax=Planctomonas sp. JC2975 TaxID=2729626 RepID=UPI00185B6F47|nr:glycerate kinase [Planctomonas sp. JC2975]NNC13880.1 glycerate kinase [Planctomonas sp. JC2975]